MVLCWCMEHILGEAQSGAEPVLYCIIMGWMEH